MQNLNIKHIVVNGSSETADPYNKTLCYAQGDDMINAVKFF